MLSTDQGASYDSHWAQNVLHAGTDRLRQPLRQNLTEITAASAPWAVECKPSQDHQKTGDPAVRTQQCENLPEMGLKEKDDDLSAADRQLFRTAVGHVKPVQVNHASMNTPRPRPLPVQTQRHHREVLDDMLHGDFDPAELETGEELLFQQPGLQAGLLRKLRRGQLSLEGRLDLHGMTVPIARAAIAEFLRQCRLTGKRCVIVIHGKGNGSAQRQPILKGKVNAWLQRRSEVLAFCSARAVDGGTGAIYVLLKRG